MDGALRGGGVELQQGRGCRRLAMLHGWWCGGAGAADARSTGQVCQPAAVWPANLESASTLAPLLCVLLQCSDTPTRCNLKPQGV